MIEFEAYNTTPAETVEPRFFIDNEMSILEDVEKNPQGISGALHYNRHIFTMMIYNILVEKAKMWREAGEPQYNIELILRDFNEYLQKYVSDWSAYFRPLLAIPDEEVINTSEPIERRSQVIGIAAYASMSLFTDLMINYDRHNKKIFGVLEGDKIDVEINEQYSTKKYLLEYGWVIAEMNLFSVGDFMKNPKTNLKQALLDMALMRFDESVIFLGRESQWINLLNQLNDEPLPLTDNDE